MVNSACNICGLESQRYATATIRGRYGIAYYLCQNCQFIQTEVPYWLSEAYAEPINRSDVGYLNRNLYLAEIAPSVISLTANPSGTFLDYGGGYGVFARLMRDLGYDFHVFDRHCPNLFAAAFQLTDLTRRGFTIVTAFEVFEHLPDPSSALGEMLAFSDIVFFSTELMPSPPPQPHEWEYFGLDHGQHVSLYSLTSLRALALRHSVHLVSNGRNLHLFSKSPVSPALFWLFTKRRFCRLHNLIFRRPSLSRADQAAAQRTAVEAEGNNLRD